MNFIKKTIFPPKIIILNTNTKFIKKGIEINYFDKDNNIGYIRYKLDGQIGLLYLEPKYRGFGIGKIMVDNVISEMKEKNISEAWLVTIPEHKFWKQNEFTWREPAHKNVTGNGFFKKII
jgi:GNAT superfamily N-acetyltransferase